MKHIIITTMIVLASNLVMFMVGFNAGLKRASALIDQRFPNVKEAMRSK